MKEKTFETTEKWFWTEPTEDEFETLRHEKTFYRLYFIDEKTKEDIILYKFWADGDEEALKTLNEFKADHPDLEHEVFYGTSGYYVNSRGKRFDSLIDMFKGKKIWLITPIVDFFMYDIPRMWGDLIGNIKNTIHFVRTKHQKSEAWDIYSHILMDLKYNLPILIRDHIGHPTFLCEKAREMLKTENPKPFEYTEEESNLASHLWEEMLNNLYKDVLLYFYYSEYGIVDSKDEEMVKIDKEYRKTLPFKEGTNGGFDYSKLGELENKHWDAIWDWMKEYGRCLWD